MLSTPKVVKKKFKNFSPCHNTIFPSFTCIAAAAAAGVGEWVRHCWTYVMKNDAYFCVKKDSPTAPSGGKLGREREKRNTRFISFFSPFLIVTNSPTTFFKYTFPYFLLKELKAIFPIFPHLYWPSDIFPHLSIFFKQQKSYCNFRLIFIALVFSNFLLSANSQAYAKNSAYIFFIFWNCCDSMSRNEKLGNKCQLLLLR